MLLQPFRCLASFSADAVDYAGVLQYDDPQTISFAFTSPEPLEGLEIRLKQSNLSVTFGGTALRFSSLASLPLPPFQPQTMLLLFAQIGSRPMPVAQDGSTNGLFGDGTYSMLTEESTGFPVRLETDDLSFQFMHMHASAA